METLKCRINALEDEINRQLLRLQMESDGTEQVIRQQEQHIRAVEGRLLESQMREKNLESMLRESEQQICVYALKLRAGEERLNSIANLKDAGQGDACRDIKEDHPEEVRELVAQLLLEQETSMHLRESVGSLQKRLEAALHEARRSVAETAECKKNIKKLEEHLETRKCLVLRLQQEVERLEARMKQAEQEHEEYKLSLTKKMSSVQQHLQRLRDDRAELLSSRPLLEAQVRIACSKYLRFPAPQAAWIRSSVSAALTTPRAADFSARVDDGSRRERARGTAAQCGAGVSLRGGARTAGAPSAARPALCAARRLPPHLRQPAPAEG